MAENHEGLLLKVVTPNGEAASIPCDSVRIQLPDDPNGKNGGWLGIRKGHTDALLAVSAGEVLVLRDGILLRTIRVSDGFANVRDDVVTVFTESVEM